MTSCGAAVCQSFCLNYYTKSQSCFRIILCVVRDRGRLCFGKSSGVLTA